MPPDDKKSSSETRVAATTAAPVSLAALIACHDCDLLHERSPLEAGGAAKCSRCGSVLYRRPVDSLNRSLSYALCAVVLFALANFYPFLYFKIQGRVEVNTMFTGVVRLNRYGEWSLAILVLLVSIVMPGLKIFSNLYVLLPLKLGRVPRGLASVFRFQRSITQWGMLEVYMIGVLIAIVNLLAMASIDLGPAFFAFIALMLSTTACSAATDPELVWSALERER